MRKSCIALISGGLDSALAAKLMLEQGIAVHGFCMTMPWQDTEPESVKNIASQLGIPLRIQPMGTDYFEVIKNPKYGYGRQINPCADCHIYMLKKARSLMESIGASFVVTGEVLGQRPMSQLKKWLGAVEKDSHLEGLLLRPLSARLLKETIPEKEKIIDRSKLLGISGRSRRLQLALASKYSLSGFSQAAGGCLLTDANFAMKLKELIKTNESLSSEELKLLAIGRHYRIDEETKIILGRNHKENEMLAHHASYSSRCCLIVPQFAAPSALILGKASPDSRKAALGLIVSYAKADKFPTSGTYFKCNGEMLALGKVDP